MVVYFKSFSAPVTASIAAHGAGPNAATVRVPAATSVLPASQISSTTMCCRLPAATSACRVRASDHRPPPPPRTNLKLVVAAALQAYRGLPLRLPLPHPRQCLCHALAVGSQRSVHALCRDFPGRHAQVGAHDDDHFEFLQLERWGGSRQKQARGGLLGDRQRERHCCFRIVSLWSIVTKESACFYIQTQRGGSLDPTSSQRAGARGRGAPAAAPARRLMRQTPAPAERAWPLHLHLHAAAAAACLLLQRRCPRRLLSSRCML